MSTSTRCNTLLSVEGTKEKKTKIDAPIILELSNKSMRKKSSLVFSVNHSHSFIVDLDCTKTNDSFSLLTAAGKIEQENI
jgi:hypothetical protein